MLGSLIPSSRWLARTLMRHIPWETARVVVEYGPGVGTLTTEILERLHPDGVLVAIERNPEFVDFLQTQITDPRLRVFHGSAENVDRVLEMLGVGPADCIISGIPYSTLPEPIRETILRRSRQVLGRGGLFLVYQFTSAVAKHMRDTFGAVQEDFEFRNILPARIFAARK